jgi:hypothetical protein
VKVSLAAEAEQALVEGALFYAREANAELGHAFVSELERSAALLLEHPALAPFGAAQFGVCWRLLISVASRASGVLARRTGAGSRSRP